MKFFNPKDWWDWVSWGGIIYIIIGGILTIGTWEQWKWGYFSIDIIPYLMILYLLWEVEKYIKRERKWKWIKEKFAKDEVNE